MPEAGRFRQVSRRRALETLLMAPALTACTALLRGDEPTVAQQVYGQLMCNCGCNQILGECNHIGCPNSVPMRAEVDSYLADGHTADETVAMFVNKYGPNIRSAPPGDGWFNVSAWIMPFIGLAAGGTAVTFYLLRMLRKGHEVEPIGLTAQTDKRTLDRIESELAEFTPED